MCGPLEHPQPPHFYLLWVSVCANAALKDQMIKRGTAPPEDSRPVCSQGVDLGGVAPPLEGMTQYRKKWPVQETLWSTVDKMYKSSQCTI